MHANRHVAEGWAFQHNLGVPISKPRNEAGSLDHPFYIIERGKLLMHGTIEEVYRRIRRNRIIEIKFLDKMEVGVSIIRKQPIMSR